MCNVKWDGIFIQKLQSSFLSPLFLYFFPLFPFSTSYFSPFICIMLNERTCSCTGRGSSLSSPPPPSASSPPSTPRTYTGEVTPRIHRFVYTIQVREYSTRLFWFLIRQKYCTILEGFSFTHFKFLIIQFGFSSFIL